jgi:hypothetical protein
LDPPVWFSTPQAQACGVFLCRFELPKSPDIGWKSAPGGAFQQIRILRIAVRAGVHADGKTAGV